MSLHLPPALSHLSSLAALIGFIAIGPPGIPDVHAEEMGMMPPGRTDAGGSDAHAHHHHAVVPALSRTTASYAIPDVRLTNQNGELISLRTLLEGPEPVLLNFIFTSCTTICPVMSGTFAQVQKDLGPDVGKVRMISISIDPEHDTPAQLTTYAKRFDAGPQWFFLTGKPEDIVVVQRAFDAYRGDKMNHTPLTLLQQSPGAEWVRYDGFASGADLAKETQGMIGS
ncbi:MAG: SCO family protein [Chromatiaceae bacterium]